MKPLTWLKGAIAIGLIVMIPSCKAYWSCSEWGSFAATVATLRDRGETQDYTAKRFLTAVTRGLAGVDDVVPGLQIIDLAYKLKTMPAEDFVGGLTQSCTKARQEKEVRYDYPKLRPLKEVVRQ